MITCIRAFFNERDVLEVDTPLLCSAGVTEPSIDPFIVPYGAAQKGPRFLQTSPEYAMKRLLAAGSGPIYQIAKAFRDGEVGPRHNPEFTLLEWYRPAYDHHQLMNELADLVCCCLGRDQWQKISYRELFAEHLTVDPFTAPLEQLRAVAQQHIDVSFDSQDRDLWLDLLMSHLIEPKLVDSGMCFVYDYPASQAALAKVVSAGDVDVGQRFELYVDGLEVANGYCELTDPVEQARRFEQDNQKRCTRGLEEMPIDRLLLAAMEHGLPPCSGVAVGLDRLIMLATGNNDIRSVLPFNWTRC
jgi:lysyl-tRNA synthetase class 2